MSGLFGGGSGSTKKTSPVNALQLQNSTRGIPIPLAYGKPRLPGNLIWYGDLVPTAHTDNSSGGGKGGGGGGGPVSYTYTAAVIMAQCEGAINTIQRVWRDKEVFTGTPTTNQVTTAQDEWYIVSGGYTGGTVTVVNAATWLGDVQVTQDATQWDGLAYRVTLTPGVNYTVSAGVYTFLPGNGGLVYITYTYNMVTAAQDACQQLGLNTTLGTYSQTALGWMTTSHPTEALAYRGISYVSGSSYAIDDNANFPNHSFEIDTQFGYSPTIRDANPKDVLVDLLTNAYYGAGFPASKMGDLTDYSNFCVANNLFISPAYTGQAASREMITQIMTITNSGALYSGGKLRFVPLGDLAATAHGVTFTPNTTPVYDLTDDDFLGDASDDPIKVTRTPNSDAYNNVRVKFYNRENSYNEEIAEAKDQANIELYGLRAMDVMDCTELCDATAARSVAQLVLQRGLYIRNTFEFRLGWSKALLEPMDLVTLTDSGLGMDHLPARIMSIEEDENGELLVNAEEFPLNVCHAAIYNTQPPLGYAANFNVDPGNAHAPVIFEPPIELATSSDFVDLWIASGGGANFGGCEIWLSNNSAGTYKRVGVLTGKSRYGSSTATLASETAPGIYSQTLSVSLISGSGALLSGVAADNAALATLCYLGGEFLSYETATLTGANAYNLATLNRGAYGTGQASHASAQDFVRVDDNLAKIQLTQDYIGTTVHIKLLSFNQFGTARQSLASVSAISYAVTGRFVKLPPPDVSSLSFSTLPDDRRQFTFSASSAPLDVQNGGGYRIKYRTTGSGTAWGSMTALKTGLITESPFECSTPAAGTYDFGIVMVDKMGNESVNALIISAGTLSAVPTKTVLQADITPGAVDTTQLATSGVTTTKIAPAAATELYSTTDAGPHTSAAYVSAPLYIQFTPSASGSLNIVASGNILMTNSTGSASQIDTYVGVSLYEIPGVGYPIYLDSMFLEYANPVANGISAIQGVNITKTMTGLTAGTVYQAIFVYADAAITNLPTSIANLLLKLEMIKR